MTRVIKRMDERACTSDILLIKESSRYFEIITEVQQFGAVTKFGYPQFDRLFKLFDGYFPLLPLVKITFPLVKITFPLVKITFPLVKILFH